MKIRVKLFHIEDNWRDTLVTLDSCNEVWLTGSTPENWIESAVTPIIKVFSFGAFSVETEC